jgi:hypothetical protein
MSQQVVGIGTVAGDHTGDLPRVAFGKINSNFTELYGVSASLASAAFQPSSAFDAAGSAAAISKSSLGLGSVTNDAQAKAAIVPNTVPTAGQFLIGNAGGTAYVPNSISGDATISSTGALTVTKTSGVSFGALATQNGTFSGTSSGVNTGDQTITLTGEATGTGSGSFAVTLTNSAVIGKVLTGFTAGAGTVSAADSMLAAIQKVVGNANALGTLSALSAAPAGTLSGTTLNATVVTSSLTSLGTIATGVWQGTPIGASYGGAGTINGLLKANGSGVVSLASSGTDYQVPITLTTTGSSGAATFSAGTLNIPQYGGGSSYTFSTGLTNTSGTVTINASQALTALTASVTISSNGAASTPSVLINGTVFTGGTASTTTPLFLVQPSGTSGTAWGTNGTLIGANSASGYTGNLIDLQANSTSRFKVDNAGNLFGGNTYINNLACGQISCTNKLYSYQNIVTAGWGVPAIYGSGRVTAQAAAAATVATYTNTAADGSYNVYANVNITASATFSFSMTVTYTDESNTGRTATMSFQSVAGVISTTLTNTGGTGPYSGVTLPIRCKASTAITVSTTGTFTSVTYNAEATITRVS